MEQLKHPPHFQAPKYREYTIPFSESNLDWVEKVSRWHCSFFQGILFYRHNNFDIRIWVEEPAEVLFTSENIEHERLEPDVWERLQLQISALKQAAEELSPQLDYIDFSRFQVLPGNRIFFPVLFDFSPRRHEEHKGNFLVGNGGDRSVSGCTRDEEGRSRNYRFKDNEAYLYKYDDFAATILDAYPITGLRGGAPLKINIKTADGVRRDVIKTALYHRHWGDDVFFADLAYRAGGLPEAVAGLLPEEEEREPGMDDRDDFVDIIHRLHLFLKKSSYRTMVLMLDRPVDRGDARFIDYLPDAPGPGNIRRDIDIVLICFDTLDPNGELPGLDFQLELKEKAVNYLERYLPIASEPALEHLEMPRPGYGTSPPQEPEKAPEPVEQAVQLVRAFRLQEAREYILSLPGNGVPRSLALKLELAEVYKWEREHEKLGELLEAIERDLPQRGGAGKYLEEQWNRFHYLSLLNAEREGNQDLADAHRAEIASGWYGKCADIRLSDRLIYGGKLDRAETLLTELCTYFRSRGCTVQEIETRSQLAKLYRKRHLVEKAEILYRNLFIKSEMKGYGLLSAGLAVDLGNLYLGGDTVNQAEVWYRRALGIYRDHHNRNGIVLVKSNMVDILIVKGRWQEAKEYLETSMAHEKKKKALLPMAIDYYNIARLEYLKRNFSEAAKFLETAIEIFEGSNAADMLAEGRLLDIMISHMRRPGGEIDFEFLNRLLPKGSAAFSTADRLPEALASTTPKSLQFQLTVLMLHLPRYRKPELAELLKILSIELGKGEKNYYYYEYYYTVNHAFSCSFPGNSEEPGERGSRDRCFTDAYYFFLKNRRRMSDAVTQYKEDLDREASGYDVFKSARMVEDSLNWKIPEDFFNSLVNQLRRELPDQGEALEMMKLVIREKGAGETEPLFSFATSRQFDALTEEMAYYARRHSEHLDLGSEEIRHRREFTSPEKAFYSYPATKVLLWKLSEELFGVLVLAFSHEEFLSYDILERHSDLLSRFAPLIRRYYERDYRLNRTLGFIIGESMVVKELKEKIARVSVVDFSLLIRGESGSGKELVAKGVHLLSRRAGQAFVPVNAAAIPENLLEAELFGYKKGAFTGAGEDRSGLIESANEGTLFLDEIADLPLQLQAKLLRVLQEKEIRRVGEHKTRPVNIRLITATNKDLKEMIREGTFREDLYYRLGDLTLPVPPLRERLEDIPLLVSHFLEKYGFEPGADRTALRSITQYFLIRGHAYAWPGNIRELESCIKRLITFYPEFERDPASVTILDTDTDLEKGGNAIAGNGRTLKDAKKDLERLLIRITLKANDWNKVKTAAVLDVSRQRLFNMMKEYGIPLISGDQ